ncbi:MAG: TetR/AcrR family transcriptional regulator [Halieaceae bacterium]|nr:TetR/AcrR family transcriptional regulator [Halieaceae bacterium]
MKVRKKGSKRGSYKKGEDRKDTILDAAYNLLINSGYYNLSLRKIADSAGISIGNLQYYFPSKDMLVEAMLDRVIQGYLDSFIEIRRHGTPQEQFLAIIEEVITDLGTKHTTVFFPELWSLSNHQKGVTKAMDAMYDRYRQVLVDIICDMNPALSADQARRLALFISSSIEGHTVFIGYRKPWNKETGNLVKMAQQSFLWLVMEGEIPA